MFGTLKHIHKRIVHYADPRTAVKAHTNLAKRVVAFHVRAAEGAAHFAERQARKDYVKGNRYLAASAKIVTPILAAVASFIPVVGWVAGYVIAGAGYAIQRVSSGVEGRSKGIQGLENRDRARGAAKRTLKYGLIGAGIGNLVSGIVALVSTAGATAAAGAGEAAGEAAGNAAGESAGNAAGAASLETGASAGVPTVAASGEVAASVGTPQIGSVVDVTQAGGWSLNTGAQATAEETVRAALVQPGLAQASGAAAASGSGILGTGVSWGDVGKFLAGVGPSLFKAFGPQAGGAPANPLGPGGVGGGGSGGGEGTAPTGDGGLLDSITGLPTWVKVGAAILGTGVVLVAVTKKGVS